MKCGVTYGVVISVGKSQMRHFRICEYEGVLEQVLCTSCRIGNREKRLNGMYVTNSEGSSSFSMYISLER